VKRSTVSERALILAPRGRDAFIAAGILREAGLAAEPAPSVAELITQLNAGAAFVVVTEEALATADLAPLDAWLRDQEEWSDLPFVLLTTGGGGLERNPAAKRYLDVLGNVTFLERPFHPTTLVSLARSALRGRRRQYEARRRLEDLRESEARRAAALRIARLGTFEWQLTTNAITLDDRAREIFGFAHHEGSTAQDVFERIHPDDLPRVHAQAMAAIEAVSRLETDYRICVPDGTTRIVDSHSDVIAGSTGKAERLVGVFADITERRRVESALRESEARYRTLFENIDEGFCIIEFLDGPHGPLSDYVHVEANPAYAIHAGIANVVGQKVREMVPDEAGDWVALYRRVLVTGEPIRFERELVATGRYLELAAFQIEPASRRQVAVVFRDITARRRAELALRELNETLERRVAEALAEQKLLADIVEGTDAFVQVVNRDYRWLAINRAAANEFERIFGIRPKAGQSMLDLLADQPEHQRDVKSVWSRALAGEEFTEIAPFGDPGRDRRFYEMKFNALRDKDGVLIGAYQFVYDVTERLAAQDRLAQTEEALRQAQKMEAVGQLTGGVAHDFNNLLTIIKSSTDLLRRPNVSEDRRRRYVDAISDTVDRASKLTGQLLAFARRQALKPELFDAGERIQAVADMLRTVVGARVDIVTDLGRERCVVEADVSQFETALVNMVVNARDAMNGEGRLVIRVSTESAMPGIRGHGGGFGPFVAVSLTDTGSGIPPDKLPHIFEPFYTTKEVGKGTGLGLSQVYGFAKQSGGDVVVESEVGLGTTFTLYLPRARDKVTDEATQDTRGSPVVADGRGRRVLVVEDNVEVGTFSTQLLQDLGYETTWAANADEALAILAEANGFDAVFSDVVMPGMSGVELGQEIRRRHPGLPVVLTSGYSEVLAQEGRHGFELLQKPYAAEQLSRVLRRVTRGVRPRGP
jgi:PAS domain S-box-containing protein